jgi:hypothetical protein
MRFSLFAILSGLAALAVVSALPVENLQRDVPFEDVSVPEGPCCGVSLILRLTADMYSSTGQNFPNCCH